MTTPEYVRAPSLSDAVGRLTRPGAVPMGGGTDLVAAIREHVVEAGELVDLRHVPGLDGIELHGDGSMRIGAATPLAHIAAHAEVRARFPALAAACDVVATPALRNMGTLGGNLCQRPRCWYYRQNFPCYKHGGTTCFAYEGENQYHAILGGGPCYIVHPSDCAVALMTLAASLRVAGPSGERVIPIDDFFVLPASRLDAEHVLQGGELIVDVELPAHSSGGAQHFDKMMQRGAWDFAIVSLAAVRRTSGDVRLVLGGVAPIPWRVTSSVEEDVASGNLSQDDIDTLADRALYDARPLAKNGYKVDAAGALLRRGIAAVQAGGTTSRT
jgi:xanthine dehydrogenase YagS FAD-binding subunit